MKISDYKNTIIALKFSDSFELKTRRVLVISVITEDNNLEKRLDKLSELYRQLNRAKLMFKRKKLLKQIDTVEDAILRYCEKQLFVLNIA